MIDIHFIVQAMNNEFNDFYFDGKAFGWVIIRNCANNNGVKSFMDIELTKGYYFSPS